MGVCLGDVFRGEVFVSEWRNEEAVVRSRRTG